MCCGTKRLTEIACPSDCVYLAAAREHPPAVAVRRQKHDIGSVARHMRDLSEQQNLAAEKAEVLARLKSLAQAAHQPAVEGTVHNREIHERDRQAKFGDTQPQN